MRRSPERDSARQAREASVVRPRGAAVRRDRAVSAIVSATGER